MFFSQYVPQSLYIQIHTQIILKFLKNSIQKNVFFREILRLETFRVDQKKIIDAFEPYDCPLFIISILTAILIILSKLSLDSKNVVKIGLRNSGDSEKV